MPNENRYVNYKNNRKGAPYYCFSHTDVDYSFQGGKFKMIINHNIPALNAYRQLSINNSNTQKALERLSSGLRINRAADDAAGLANSEKTPCANQRA